MAGPLAASLAVHGALVLAAAVGARVSWPAPPIPVEVLMPHRAVREVGPEERRGDRRAPPPVEKTAAPRKSPGPSGPPPPPPRPTIAPPQTTDLRPFAPDDAHLVVLLRSDKLRRSPHRAGVDALLGTLPDYRMLLDGTGLTPIDDFEALLIATADPHDVTATFVAARFHDSPRLRAVTARPVRPGDPRVFRVLAPGLAVLLQPSDAARLDAVRAVDGGAAEDPRARWLADLERFDRVARDDGGPAVVVTLSDAPTLIRLGDGLPTPQAIALAATADAAPAVRIKLAFAAAAEAEIFAAAWPEIVRRWHQRTGLLGLGPALDDLTLTRDGAQLDLAGHVPEAQLRIGLAFARALVPAGAPVDGGEPAR